MKRYILLPILLLAPCTMPLLQAQDTYMNERLVNSSSDVIGTARYVGMGGALGALGADISVISWNPAGIGLYRKNDIALTFGGLWGKSHIDEENRGKGTFDQAGFVYNIDTGGDACPYVNFAFNYQKKKNFNYNFYAINDNLGGLSQMDQLAELTYWDNGQTNLAGMAIDKGYFSTGTDDNGETYYYNYYAAYGNKYTHHSEGSLQSFDFNLSTNINDRAFLGLTVGVDNMRYRGMSLYEEFCDNPNGNYPLSCNYNISGTGVNVKLGAIIRPIESNSFRVGLAVETPTWYRLHNTTWFDFNYELTDDKAWPSDLRFKLRSPWKVRASMGSTVGSSFAWDIDYEYAAYAGISMGYPEYDNGWGGNIKDAAMNKLTSNYLRGTHTLRVGLEANASKHLAFRLGYNLSTSAYKKDISFDQMNIDSKAMNYATGTSYMRMGNTNILTLGMGYRYKNFYIDLAYKIRHQKADFYAFDTNFTNGETGDPVFLNNAPELKDASIDPVDVDLTRQAITCTLGFKF